MEFMWPCFGLGLLAGALLASAWWASTVDRLLGHKPKAPPPGL